MAHPALRASIVCTRPKRFDMRRPSEEKAALAMGIITWEKAGEGGRRWEKAREGGVGDRHHYEDGLHADGRQLQVLLEEERKVPGRRR